jgi:uncharacterized membrane protein YgcG
MKTAIKIITTAFLLAATLLTGAASAAPVMVSNSYYINDYAEALNADYRDAMLETSKELYAETGSQLVVLTVKSMSAGSGEASEAVDAYAERVFNGWQVGGGEGNGILLFLATEDKQSSIYAGQGLTDERLLEKLEFISGQMYKEFADGEYARGLYNGFYDVADELFFENGATREAAKPDFKAPSFGGPLEYGAIFVFVVLILLRGWRIFGKRHKTPERTYLTHKFPPRSRGLVYNSEKGEYEEKTDDPDDRDDLPSGFGGAVTVKEHVYEEGAEPVQDFWQSQWDEFESDSGGRN